ncbi:hypothetical protein G7054_g5732 [Neopestalotiopsis clavispora]|nr:hypothetical protein G7054_g5732 [Neopestalotiopsis clavispora]
MNPQGADVLEFGNGNTVIDPQVLRALPEKCTVKATKRHGASFWANTGRIDVQMEDGSLKSLFIKVMLGETGRNMVLSEFESAKAMHDLQPHLVPRPISWGTYESVPDTHFFLCEFREMVNEMPDPHKFAAQLAALHQDSQSPTGKFGFHVTTYSGNLPQVTDWEDSWETFFTKSLKLALKLELRAKGPNTEFDTLLPVLFETVIPRLLRPLESDGRKVKSSLIHGDLWFANSGIDKVDFHRTTTDFAGADEFGQWMPTCNRFGAEYLAAYHSNVTISQPEEDYQGRLDLYKL